MTDAGDHEASGTPSPAPPPPPAEPAPPAPIGAPAPPAPPPATGGFAPRRLTIGPAQIVVLLGVAAITASIFLHWLDFSISVLGVHRSTSASASDVPVAFLFDYKTTSNDPSLLVVLVPIVVIALIDVLLLRHRVLTFITAVVTFVVVGLYTYQLDQTRGRISDVSRNVINPSLTDLLGIAPYVAFAGGILLLVGALMTRPGSSAAARGSGPASDARLYPPRLPSAPPRGTAELPAPDSRDELPDGGDEPDAPPPL
jgi:hypothetical protein